MPDTIADIFTQNMQAAGVPAAARVAVAVSGGGDSMALCLLMRDRGADVLALTVDHGLRAESAAEAEAVAAEMARLGIAHRILPWRGDKPASGVQESARAARYGLLLSACRAAGIRYLALAHNLEDQAETFWMRLAHGSGLDGLSSMPRSREEEGVTLLRPLLDVPRAALRDLCRARGVGYVDDPSNSDEKYLRVRLRAFEALLAAEGFTPDRLARTVQKLQDARAALEWVTDSIFTQLCEWGDDGTVILDTAGWSVYPADLRRRVLVQAMQAVCPQDYPPPDAALRRLENALLDKGFTGCTLAGCRLKGLPAGVLIAPEAAAYGKNKASTMIV